jgi:hypothetical protein
MALTLRQTTATGATNKGSELTYSELDANFVHLLESSNHNFTPSGTGGVAETVSEALQRMVFNGQYSSAANFNTARDALTDTAAVRALQIGVSSVGGNANIFFPARTSGRGQQGIISYDVTFNSTVDPNLSIGYNLAADGTAAQAGEPQAHLAFEGNYNDGSGDNKMEVYFQFGGLTGQAAETRRPYFISANRDTSEITNQFFATLHQFGGLDAATATSAMDVYPTHVDFPGGQGAAANYLTIAGATSGNIPILSAAGYSDTNVNIGYSSKGTGGHIFYTGAGSRVVLVLNNVASSVNYPEFVPAATTGTVVLRVAGSDTDVALAISSKGSDAIRFFTDTTAAEQVQIIHTASASRHVTLTGSNGANPAISVSAGELAIGTNAWTLGVANAVSPTSPNRTLTVTVGGTTYYIHAKTTND